MPPCFVLRRPTASRIQIGGDDEERTAMIMADSGGRERERERERRGASEVAAWRFSFLFFSTLAACALESGEHIS